MYKVLPASLNDIEELLSIAENFWKESPTYKKKSFNIQKVECHLMECIESYTGCLFKCVDDDNNILGGFVGFAQPDWMSDEFIAYDSCLFVRPEYRGTRCAYLLVTAFKYWAKSIGCTYIQCGTNTMINADRTIKFYKKLGFSHLGSFLEMDLLEE